MIHYIRNGDLFKSNADILVNTVNCVGVMGKGIALEFKKRFPEYYERYRKLCFANEMIPGTPVWDHGQTPTIISFPTKLHWRAPSRIEWIETGLARLATRLMVEDKKTIAIPALGCQNGGLNWMDVRPLISQALDTLPTTIYIYEPHS